MAACQSKPEPLSSSERAHRDLHRALHPQGTITAHAGAQNRQGLGTSRHGRGSEQHSNGGTATCSDAADAGAIHLHERQFRGDLLQQELGARVEECHRLNHPDKLGTSRRATRRQHPAGDPDGPAVITADCAAVCAAVCAEVCGWPTDPHRHDESLDRAGLVILQELTSPRSDAATAAWKNRHSDVPKDRRPARFRAVAVHPGRTDSGSCR